MKKTLKQLYKEHKGKLSDKWSLYLTELDRLFTPYQGRPIRLLEIGVQNGGSLEIWDQYFQKAEKIVGCDINQKCAGLQYQSSRIVVVTGDANSDEFQSEILQYSSNFDIIIDDGSHKSGDIVRSFARYFPFLNDDGIYMAEDLHCSYWNDFEGGLHQPFSAIAFFKRLTDIINHEHWRNSKSRKELIAGFCDEFGVEFDDLELSKIHSIEFLNSLCVIKKELPENNVLGRRVIVGVDEGVTSGVKKYDGTTIQDFEAVIKDDSNLDVFELLKRSRELVEMEQVVQALNTKLTEIYGSRAWKLIQLLRRIRVMVIPHGGSIERFAMAVKKKSSHTLQRLINSVAQIEFNLKKSRKSKAWNFGSFRCREYSMVAPYGSRLIRVLSFLIKKGRGAYRIIKQKIDFKKKLSLINSSGLFDKDWYLANNPDVAISKKDPASHYLMFGGLDGRDPGPDFSSWQYLNNNKDVKEARTNPLVHFLTSGMAEGREKFSTYNINDHSRKALNVIFISGEPETPGHVYRVERYIETYKALGINAAWHRPSELAGDLSALDAVQLLIIWRAFYDANVELIINYAKQKQIKIVFDVDDLMFDVNVVDSQIIDAIRFQNLDIETVRHFYLGILKTMLQADICTCPTRTLSEAVENFNKESFVLPNGYDYDQFYRSIAHLREKPARNDEVIRIGYAGGTQTHQKDFKQALPALLNLLEEYPDIIITIFGEALDIGEFPEVQGYEHRFETRKMVPLKDLVDEIARFDINIAPLEINQFCEAKSELKYFEAALVKIPTIASPTYPFKNAIQHGVNGFLAYNDSDWYKYLKMLIESEALRNSISNRAFQHVLWHFSPEQRVYSVYCFLDKINLSYHTNFSEIRGKAFSFHKKLAPFIATNQKTMPDYDKLDKLFENKTRKMSKVGVVIPLFNDEDFLVETLESISSQSIEVLDLVIVDDCSTDGSLNVAISWLSRHNDRFANCAILHNVEKQGLSASRNIGFDYLQTPWVMPVDADNVLLPKCLEECSKFIMENSFSCVYTKLLLFGEETGFIQEVYGGMELNIVEWDPARLALYNYIDVMALISKAAWARVGGYDVTLKHGLEDYDLWLKFVEKGLFAKYIPNVLAKNRVYKKSTHGAVANISVIERRKEIIERHPWINEFLKDGV